MLCLPLALFSLFLARRSARRAILRTRWQQAAAFALAVIVAAPCKAGDPGLVTIRLIDGRAYCGRIDPRSDASELWLRFERGGITVRRPFTWSELASVDVTNQTADVAAWRQSVLASPAVGAPPPRVKSARNVRRETSGEIAPLAERPAPVRSLRIEASVANWDQDVENDGILLVLQPLDASGSLVPASGTVAVDLVGEGPGTPAFRETFPLVNNWLRMLDPADLTPRGYLLRLEFQAIHPEFNLRVGPAGLVHARLTVPGSGAFEASTGTIAVRPINPIRDRLQTQQNSRFFPWEWTGQGKQD